jgi:hypothetical protein
MRAVKLLVSSILSIAVVLCLAGSAMAGTITSVQASVSVNPADPGDVTVNSSASQAEPFTTIQVATFMMTAWDSECSSAGYPYPEGTPNGVIEDSNFTTMTGGIIGDFITNFVDTHQGESMCVGTVAWDNDQVVVDAHRVFYNRPYIDYSWDGATNDSITIGLDVTPNGLATSYHLRYFKVQNTTNCYTPDAEDESYAANTASVDITSDLNEVHEVSLKITGLDKESEYCVSWHAENAVGDDDSDSWGYFTLGDIPVLQAVAFSGGVGSIDYDIDIIPGISISDTSLQLHYFVKSGDTCTAPVGGATVEDISYKGPGEEGLRGFNAISVENELTGLEPATAYCIRVRTGNDYGMAAAPSYQTVTTLEQEKGTVDNFRVTPYEDLEYPHAMKFTLNDHGAKAVTGDDSYYEYDVYKTPPVDCNAGNYNDGPGTIGSGGYFHDTDPTTVSFSNFEIGQAYCVRFTLESSFGSDFDSEYYFSYYGGSAPELTDVSTGVNHTDISVAATINPGYQETMFGIVYFKLSGTDDCSTADEEDFSYLEVGGTLAAGQTGPFARGTTLSGLDPNSDYCVRYIASSGLGEDQSDSIMLTTGPELDTEPPSKPTNLTASNITKTSATLSWTASTDDVGVMEYVVIDGDIGDIGTTSSTSISVALTCGQTSIFHVKARDADNESDKSDTLEITGAACDVPAPPGDGGSTTPPAKKLCFSPIDSKSVKGKKMSIKLTFKVSADGQSIALSSKVKGTKLTFKIDGKTITPKKGGVTIPALATSVTVSYKVKKSVKKIKITPKRFTC